MNSLRTRALGFTMLEVLISIVVIAFGMLGVAGLQAYALRNSQSASYRSVATVLATDIIDRMRANPLGVTQNRYVTSAGFPVTAKATPNCLAAGGCGTQELAEHDLFEWQALIASSLPNASGVICRDSSPNDGTSASSHACEGTGALVVKIWWIDNRGARQGADAAAVSANAVLRFVTEFQI